MIYICTRDHWAYGESEEAGYTPYLKRGEYVMPDGSLPYVHAMQPAFSKEYPGYYLSGNVQRISMDAIKEIPEFEWERREVHGMPMYFMVPA